jgi:hypothetical protein
MNLHRVGECRQHADAWMESRADAVCAVCDGLWSETHARSLPERSLSPSVGRTGPRVSAALADGTITIEALPALCVRRVLADLPANALVWIAVERSSCERPEAETSEDRGAMPVSNRPLADTPVRVGWSLSFVALLPDTTSRWTPMLDVQRMARTHTAIDVAIEQLRLLTPRLGERQVSVLADRWDATPEMLRACRERGDRVLIRLKSTRTRYCAPVRTHTRGALLKDGPLVQGTRPETHHDPAAVWEGSDQADTRTRISRVDGMHVQQDRALERSVIRGERHAARGTRRDPRVRWFLTLDDVVPLAQIPER